MYNDMGMTGITGITMDIQVLHFQCPHNSNVYKSYTVIFFFFFGGGGGGGGVEMHHLLRGLI